MSEQVNNQLTRTEYANYKGVSKQMVSKWIRDNRLVLTPDEKFVLVNESDARIKLTASLNGSFYDRKAKEEKEIINQIIKEKGLTELTAEVNYQQLDLETDDADTLFKNARALREKTVSLQAAAELEAYTGAQVQRAYIEKILEERCRQLRDQLMISATSLSPLVAGHDDILVVQKILSDEYRKLLNNFAKLPIIEQ